MIVAFKVFSLTLVFSIFPMIFLGVLCILFFLIGFPQASWVVKDFHKFWKILGHYLFKRCFFAGMSLSLTSILRGKIGHELESSSLPKATEIALDHGRSLLSVLRLSKVLQGKLIEEVSSELQEILALWVLLYHQLYVASNR